MKTAFVTGDKGFVGRHMAAALQERGYSIVGADLKDGYDCRDGFRTITDRFDLIVHAAAVVGGRETISHDPLAVAVDLEIDTAMFRWAVRTRQRRVVYFSSCAAYPACLQTDGVRMAETMLPACGGTWPVGPPDLTYGWAKLTGELLAGFAEAEGVPVHIFRPFSGYGADQDLTYPFPAFIDRAARRADPFTVWGDGTAARDFIHVDDIVGAIMAAIDADYRQPVNLGTGIATRFDQLAALCAHTAGYQPRVVHDLGKPTGPLYRVADTGRLSEFYTPRVTLAEGVRRALAAR